MIERQTNADRINEIVNHPAVRPYVANSNEGVLDLTATVADQRNHILCGDHGAVAFLWAQDGIYEAHTQVLPRGRGEWTRELTEACVRHMFTRTDAYEIMTRVPAGHIAAKTAAEAQGMRFEFTRPRGVMFRDRVVDCHIYSFRLQDWVARTPVLAETGEWLHERMEEEAARLALDVEPHEADDNHNRYVGAAIEMAFGGQWAKAVGFYNRWVTAARHIRNGKLQHVQLVSVDPLVVRFDIGLMRFHADDIEVIREC
jgi:hypothetical protein